MLTTFAWGLLALATFAETLVYGSASPGCAPQVVVEEKTLEYFVLNDARYGYCSNTEPIPALTECMGPCSSKTVFNPVTRNFTSSCFCCTVKASVPKKVALTCTGGRTLQMDYRNPTECICTKCAGIERSGAGSSSGSSDFAVPIPL